MHAQVEADDNQRKREFVVMVQGADDDEQSQLIEIRRLYAKLSEHLPPSIAAKLAAEISGEPRKAFYGAGDCPPPAAGIRQPHKPLLNAPLPSRPCAD